MRKINYIQVLRLLTQVLFLLLFTSTFIMAFEGFKRFYQMIIFHNYDISNLKIFIAPMAIIVLLNILVGRFFCGWMCSFGTISEYLYKLASKVFKTNFYIDGKLDKSLRIFK